MKKTFAILIIIVCFLIIYLLQSNFFSWFNLAGVKPNLFIILALIIGLFAGRTMGLACGMASGVFLDYIIGKNIGLYGIMLGIIGLVGGYLDKRFSKDNRVTLITIAILCTLIFESGVYILGYILNSSQISLTFFIKTILLEVFYNAIIVIIIYPIIIKYGYKLEGYFKEKNILTRYF